MTTERIRQLITIIIESFDTDEEFDTGMIWQALHTLKDESFSFATVRNILRKMIIQRRYLTKEETETWRKKFGTQPKILFKKHTGQDPNNYERGIKAKHYRRPTVAKLQIRLTNDEECAICPEWDSCQGVVIPCPRYPYKKDAPKDRVMKLRDWKNE